jgi:hypothetical protein
MNRGKGLRHDPARAAERRRRREERRRQDGARPEDVARDERRAAGGQGSPRSVEEDPDGRRLWGQHFERQPCVVCEDCPVDEQTARERRADLAKIDGAHIIAKDRLISWGLRHLKWDLRNGLPVCRYHHFRHDDAVQRIPRRLLPAKAFEFADEVNARWVLEDDDVFPPVG